MNEQKLSEICFALAENLMWEANTAPLERLPEQMDELATMTEQFVEIAKDYFIYVEDQPDGAEILFGAIQYLNAQAIPPLRGNYDWFKHSLFLLLEICNPSNGFTGLPFLLSLQKGVISSIVFAARHEKDDDY
jgi:hypothetical protein